MYDPLLDEAARQLELEPSRTLEADHLYRRARRAGATAVTFTEFIDSLRAQPRRFTVVANSCAALGDVCWNEQDRVRYERALDAVGAATPVIALAEQPTEPCWRAVPATSHVALLHDMRDSIAQLTSAPDEDAALHGLAARAIEELQAVRRALPG